MMYSSKEGYIFLGRYGEHGQIFDLDKDYVLALLVASLFQFSLIPWHEVSPGNLVFAKANPPGQELDINPCLSGKTWLLK